MVYAVKAYEGDGADYLKLRLICGLCLAVCLMTMQFGCAVSPYKVSNDVREAEIAYGKAAHVSLESFFGFYKHDVLQGYVQRVGEQLAVLSQRGDIIYRFTVIDSAEVSVFSLPGGYVYISRGLLALLNSEAQLAAVLALQVGHIVSGHVSAKFIVDNVGVQPGIAGAELAYYKGPFVVPSVYGVITEIIGRGYGLSRELEAYQLAAGYLTKANYPANALLGLYDVLSRESDKAYLITPVNVTAWLGAGFRERLVNIVSEYAWNGREPVAIINREQRFFSRLKGVRIDDNDLTRFKKGRVTHQEMGLGVTMPQGWLSVWGANLIFAYPSNLDGYIKLSPIVKNPGRALSEKISAIKALSPQAWLTEERLTVWGLRKVVQAVIEVNEQLYLIEASAKAEEVWEDYYPQFQQVMATIESLPSSGGQGKAEKNELALLVVSKPTTLEALMAKNKIYAHSDLTWIRYLNQLNESDSVKVGQYIKVTK